ncbi:lactobin A/cerein 7B family class IIb bacteriocin [Tenacibaculum skagerrakense]|uniref:Lactobin A/cerein 7B family class IIb bacteriocin n=1 Tax=Tenacibaculum skagerrakense TaxID=186571 RepID=A0A4R2NRQ8_9FLAO|nr:class IIb bacteriocin, lactobin A/cerein 7B family [Tenacibaculum skagerrakense]TCP24025.1 lactobin A/cerein 7B family class IIb bacteriocin [Tenacibaculum skagerrakense]
MKVTVEENKMGQQLYSDLVQKAWDSASFKEQLIANPRATIAAHLGKENTPSRPGEKNLIVEDQTDTSIIYLNIPAKPSLDDLELSDEELQMISGGDITLAVGAAYVVGFAVGAAATYLTAKYIL